MNSLDGHERVAIDSNVLIYLIEDAGDLGLAAGQLVDLIASGAAHGIMSTLVLTEVCSGRGYADDPALLEVVADNVRSIENTTLFPLTHDLAVDAASLRSAGVTLADAIHLATARGAGATAFVTNDRGIKSLPHLDVLYLDALIG